MPSNDNPQMDEHLADFTNQVINSDMEENVPDSTNGKEQGLEETILFIAQTIQEDPNQGVKNRVRLNANQVFLQQYKRQRESFLARFFGILQQWFVQNKAAYTFLMIAAFIIGTSAVFLLVMPGLSESLAGSAMTDHISTGFLIVISCLSLLIILILIIFRK